MESDSYAFVELRDSKSLGKGKSNECAVWALRTDLFFNHSRIVIQSAGNGIDMAVDLTLDRELVRR